MYIKFIWSWLHKNRYILLVETDIGINTVFAEEYIGANG